MLSAGKNLAPRCRLSDPTHPHTLHSRFTDLYHDPPLECFTCGPRGEEFNFGEWHYYCDTCELVFHQYCIFTPQGIRHLYHLNHPLTTTIRFSKTDIQSFNNKLGEICQIMSNIPKLDNTTVVFESNDACDWCGKELGQLFYRCLVCSFSLDGSCILQDPPFIIENPKSHQHPLTFFPRALLVACSACGLCGKEEGEPGYACLQCNYLVHKSCIDLPCVIKLTRHQHRLALTPCLPPPSKRSCGVCHKQVDIKHGLFSCNKSCSYAIHSKCAIREDIWDGIDLEGVPEELFEDVSPFKEVGYNLIKHFCHEHNLLFKEDGLAHDGNYHQCQACSRSLDSDGFYRCILDCDFFLHASCANLPKKKEHQVHKHSLTLLSTDHNTTGCEACGREVSGFVYACFNKYCETSFKIDLGCASVCEPFEHKVHPHPLYIDSQMNDSLLCGVCGEGGYYRYILKCNDCEYVMCFKCATIPVVIRYKNDEHLLILSGGEDQVGRYWCEVCERELDPKKWFYTCDECCTTLHVECVFGDFMHMKNGVDLFHGDYEFKVASNDGNTRPICYQCGARCRYNGFFKGKDICVCSFECMRNVPA